MTINKQSIMTIDGFPLSSLVAFPGFVENCGNLLFVHLLNLKLNCDVSICVTCVLFFMCLVNKLLLSLPFKTLKNQLFIAFFAWV